MNKYGNIYSGGEIMKDRMKSVRKEMGMTQQELADFLGTPKIT